MRNESQLLRAAETRIFRGTFNIILGMRVGDKSVLWLISFLRSN
jgi:hypothetical protein